MAMNRKDDYLPLDIRSGFNHKLFYKEYVEDPIQSSSGLEGLYICAKENNLNRKPVSVKGVPFKLCFGEKDNLYGNGQTVQVNAKTDELHFLGFSYFGDMNLKTVLRMNDGRTETLDVQMRNCLHDCWADGWFKFLTPEYEKIERVTRYVTTGRAKQPFYLFDRTCNLPQSCEIKEIYFSENIFVHILAITIKVDRANKN